MRFALFTAAVTVAFSAGTIAVGAGLIPPSLVHTPYVKGPSKDFQTVNGQFKLSTSTYVYDEPSKLLAEAKLLLQTDEETELARIKLMACLDYDPGRADCHKLLGLALQNKEPAESRRHYSEYLRLAPDGPDAPPIRFLMEFLGSFPRSHGS